MAFIFYDVETTGADRSFDQILQFAAVLTDDDLNVVDTFEIGSRLLPHIVPSPVAMLVTGVRVEQLFDPALPSHFEMCRRIHEVMSSWSPATVVGFNSISFDEEMLRRAFYSSLLPIYLTNTGGNSRLDILPLTIATHAFAPDGLRWPVNEKGRVSFKLDRLAPANGFAHGNAHDALADVHATIHIARLIKERVPMVWNSAMAHRSKGSATQFVEVNPVFMATRLRFGLCSSSLVTAIGTNPDNSGELFTLDLRQDPTLLLPMTNEELAAHIATKPRPVSSLKLNASPLFMPIDLAGAHAAGYELGLEEIARRAELVRNDEGLRQRLILAVLSGRATFSESPHVEDQIYGSFYSRSDQPLIDEFREASWPRRLEISAQFDDRRLRGLSRRIIYFEAPHVMPAKMRADYAHAIAARIHSRTDRSGRWTTLEEAIEDAHELLIDVSPDREAILQEHLARLTAWREEAGVILHGPNARSKTQER
ncbi:exodeoxyribonuclease I [Mesorhizobium sp. M2D.F.Ca.ET.171.01.1.1]|uniref:exodeoxyribonuclease I n=1 Tax=unclassified Mesorhizobium TaxID=325217 RepID=UPI00109286FA|nr:MULTISPECIES: exodeoxyribonuclease I [unclassified Mesorhizobium]TGS92704.1 exodeoxyribonuclease I [Mesorhizobium sp. M2D.F.Ca.ET.178.01.1.1]TGT08509.1 exodeoxyribonuclease I [Mesorhizobium sp. M2D.F.Ca.ET.171.01.1.1]